DPLRLAPPAAAAPGRWLTSGKTVYNNNGTPVRQYEPFWSPTGAYDDRAYGVYITYWYDPLVREIRIDKRKGFFSKVEFTPWRLKQYDPDDTVKDSQFYKHHINAGQCDLPPEECDALRQAARFYNTPATQVLDNTGYPFLTIEDNLGAVTKNALDAIVKDTPISAEALRDDLKQKGYLDQQDFVTERFHPYRPGFRLDLDPAYERFAAPV